jgi:NAD+ kinase
VGWLREHGIRTRSLSPEEIGADEGCSDAEFAAGLDLVLSVGGDGTLLRAARLAHRADAPLLGVKVGRLGFLTEVEPDGAPALLAQYLEGSARLEERLTLVAEPVGAPWSEPEWALNEVMVEKTERHRLITLRTEIGGEYVTTFSADGVIVGTPTGSTAYSFSAGGPIVTPRVPCVLLTPVSPHMVFDRTIVTSAEEGVVLEVQGEEPGLLSADGRPGKELPVGARVRIRTADRPLRLVRRSGSQGFFALLRDKLWLPGQAPSPGV